MVLILDGWYFRAAQRQCLWVFLYLDLQRSTSLEDYTDLLQLLNTVTGQQRKMGLRFIFRISSVLVFLCPQRTHQTLLFDIDLIGSFVLQLWVSTTSIKNVLKMFPFPSESLISFCFYNSCKKSTVLHMFPYTAFVFILYVVCIILCLNTFKVNPPQFFLWWFGAWICGNTERNGSGL